MGKTKFLCCCTWCWCFWVKLHGHRHWQTESNEPRIGGENARKWNKSKCKCNANKQSEGCSERAVTFARHCGTFHWKYLRHRSLCSFIHSSCFTFFILPFCFVLSHSKFGQNTWTLSWSQSHTPGHNSAYA